MNSSDSAELMVRMYLEGMQVVAKITGSGAKHIAAYLYASVNGKTKTKGKTSLSKMLKSGKPLKVFSIKQQDLKKFTMEAKKYGILFNVILDKNNTKTDGLVDIMVRAEDAPKINRIVERFKLATVDTATIKNEIQKSMEEKGNVKDSNPNMALAEKENLSKHSSEPINNSKNKESVKKKLNTIEKELNNKKSKNTKSKTKNKIKKER